MSGKEPLLHPAAIRERISRVTRASKVFAKSKEVFAGITLLDMAAVTVGIIANKHVLFPIAGGVELITAGVLFFALRNFRLLNPTDAQGMSLLRSASINHQISVRRRNRPKPRM